MDKLDMTDDKSRTFEELRDAIVDAVLSTQIFLIQPLPDTILLTSAQFNLLRPSEAFEPTDELMWRTHHLQTGDIINIMNIHVKGVFEPQPNMLSLI